MDEWGRLGRAEKMTERDALWDTESSNKAGPITGYRPFPLPIDLHSNRCYTLSKRDPNGLSVRVITGFKASGVLLLGGRYARRSFSNSHTFLLFHPFPNETNDENILFLKRPNDWLPRPMLRTQPRRHFIFKLTTGHCSLRALPTVTSR